MARFGDIISRLLSNGSGRHVGARGTSSVRGDAEAFIDALHALEDGRTLDPVLALFADDAELVNPNVDLHTGKDAARRFWSTYRKSFGEVHSDFHHVLTQGDCAILEWTSRGRTADGRAFEYDGVSVLEFSGGRIRRFKAYFDPASLGDQLAPGLQRHRPKIQHPAPRSP